MAQNDKTTSIILCCIGFLGIAGIHRFYRGNVVSGIIWLITGGLIGIGTIIDLILLATDNKVLFD